MKTKEGPDETHTNKHTSFENMSNKARTAKTTVCNLFVVLGSKICTKICDNIKIQWHCCGEHKEPGSKFNQILTAKSRLSCLVV